MKKLFQKIEKESNKIREFIRNLDPHCKSIYLPNPLIDSKVKYIFIAMEPSFGRWAKNEEIAQGKIEDGFKNFLYSKDDFCFHYSIDNFLSDSYHLTDISKIAMLTDNASKLRNVIYPKFINLLKEEIKEIGLPNAKIFFVGKKVEYYLSGIDLNFPVAETILHYSGNATRHRKTIPFLYPREYEEFSNNLGFDNEDIIDFAEDILRKNDFGNKISVEILSKLKRSEILTDSRKELIFTYKKAFEKF